MTHGVASMNSRLIVVGASVRALAASAQRAGWSVHAADLFADADLRATATMAIRVPATAALPWPDGLEAAMRSLPIAPWVYSGALENHPDLVDRLARERPLVGNAGDRLRAVRDPARLSRAVRAAGLSFPDTFESPVLVPADGSFLVKPVASAGGRGVVSWHGGPAAAGRIWQRFVSGRPWSAAYALGGDRPRLFGASRQLIGRRWCGARGFAWCGSVDVPIAAIPTRLRPQLDRLGDMLAGDFGLVGLVGVDFVVDHAGTAHVIEVNPRPTASMELVERATGESLISTHLTACGFPVPVPAAEPACRPAAWAKAVVFAERTLVMDGHASATIETAARCWTADDDGWPALADLPVIGSGIEPGRPTLTVFAAGRSAGMALETLRRRMATIRSILRDESVSRPSGAGEPPPPPPGGSTA